MNGLNEEIFESDYESSYEGEGEYEGEAGSYETGWSGEGPFSQEQEMELAAELLSLSRDQEMEQFLGSIISSVGRAAGKVIRSPVGKALGGLLRQAAKKALPVVGGAVGGYFGGPLGASLGSQLASQGGQMFGLELEGMSNEDKEFEVARRMVRLTGAAATKAAQFPPSMPPQKAARAALVAAARQHAPGLLRNGGGPLSGSQYGPAPFPNVGAPLPGSQYAPAPFPNGGVMPGTDPDDVSNYAGYHHRRRHGRWFRRGDRIVLVGV